MKTVTIITDYCYFDCHLYYVSQNGPLGVSIMFNVVTRSVFILIVVALRLTLRDNTSDRMHGTLNFNQSRQLSSGCSVREIKLMTANFKNCELQQFIYTWAPYINWGTAVGVSPQNPEAQAMRTEGSGFVEHDLTLVLSGLRAVSCRDWQCRSGKALRTRDIPLAVDDFILSVSINLKKCKKC